MNKILTGVHYDINVFSDSSFFTVGAGRANCFEITDDNKITKTFTSPHLTNLSRICWTTDKEYYLFSNTAGKTIVLNAKENKIEDTFYLRYEPRKNSFVGYDEGFLMINRHREIEYYNCRTKTTSRFSESQNVHCLIPANNKIYVYCVHYANNCSPEGDIIILDSSFNSPETKHAYGILQDVVIDKSGTIMLSDIHCNNSAGSGLIEPIVLFDPESENSREVLSIDCFEDVNSGCFCRIITDLRRDIAIALFSNCVKIIKISTRRVLHSEKLEYGSDVEWIDDNRVLIATWKGLYLLVIDTILDSL